MFVRVITSKLQKAFGKSRRTNPQQKRKHLRSHCLNSRLSRHILARKCRVCSTNPVLPFEMAHGFIQIQQHVSQQVTQPFTVANCPVLTHIAMDIWRRIRKNLKVDVFDMILLLTLIPQDFFVTAFELAVEYESAQLLDVIWMRCWNSVDWSAMTAPQADVDMLQTFQKSPVFTLISFARMC